jgi:hypothetical protein
LEADPIDGRVYLLSRKVARTEEVGSQRLFFFFLSVTHSSLDGTRASGRRYLGIGRTNGRGAKLRESEVVRLVPRDFGVRDLASNSSERRRARRKSTLTFPRVSGIQEVDVRRPDSREARSRIALLGIRQGGGQCERNDCGLQIPDKGEKSLKILRAVRKEGPGSATGHWRRRVAIRVVSEREIELSSLR